MVEIYHPKKKSFFDKSKKKSKKNQRSDSEKIL